MATKTPAKPKTKGKTKPKEKPKERWKEPQYWVDYSLQTVKEVEDMNEELTKLEKQFTDAIEIAKAKRAQVAEAKTAVFNYIRDRKAKYGKPPQETLTSPIERQEDAGKVKGMAAKVAANMTMDFEPDYGENGVHKDAWQKYPLADLAKFSDSPKVIEKVCKALEAGEVKGEKTRLSPVLTMGQLGDMTKASAGGWNRELTTIKGIGPEARTAFEAVQLRFWEEWKNKGLDVQFAKDNATTFEGIYREPKPVEAKKPLRGGGAKPEGKAKPTKKNVDPIADWYAEGKKVFVDGGEKSANPYKNNPEAYRRFDAGYEDAKLERTIKGEDDGVPATSDSPAGSAA